MWTTVMPQNTSETSVQEAGELAVPMDLGDVMLETKSIIKTMGIDSLASRTAP